jgi:peptide methionine sulfoxide reductase MsrA
MTQLHPSTIFYPAHKAHQQYLEVNPGGYCNHFMRFEWDKINNAPVNHEEIEVE